MFKYVKLGDLAEFRNGLNFSKSSTGSNVKIIGVTDFKSYLTPDYSELEEITIDGELKEEDYVQNGDIIFVRSNGNKDLVGRSLYIDRDSRTSFSGFCIRLRFTSSEVLPKYFAFYTKSGHFKKSISKGSLGTNINNLNQGILSDVLVPLPSVKRQKTVIKILESITYKISLNNKINAELEAMAKLIYDYWFVQFDFPISAATAASMGQPELEGKPYKASGGPMVYNKQLKREIPEGWEAFKLGELGNFKNGVNYDPSNPGEIACPIINVRNISASSYFLKNEDLDTVYLRESDVKKYSVHEGSIIIARSGIPGATRLISDFEENTLYCGFAIHYELEDLNQKLPVFFYLKSIEQLIKNGSGGTILKNVNQATLNALQIALPKNKKIVETFNKVISPQFEKINIIQKENQKLTELRDWLLPMLMNGQVSIKEAEEQLSMAAEAVEGYGNKA